MVDPPSVAYVERDGGLRNCSMVCVKGGNGHKRFGAERVVGVCYCMPIDDRREPRAACGLGFRWRRGRKDVIWGIVGIGRRF